MSGYDLIVKSEHKGPCLLNDERDAVDCLAEYAISTRLEDLPGEVLEHARHVFLDTLGVMMGGSIEPQASAMAHRLGRQGGGPCTIIGHDLQSSKLNAALVNGTAATWLDFDSGHRPPSFWTEDVCGPSASWITSWVMNCSSGLRTYSQNAWIIPSYNCWTYTVKILLKK